MKLKDTIHFNWYKHLFIVLVIGLCVTASAAVTEADILDVLGNLEQMSGFLSRFLRPDFAYIPKLIGPMISTLQMSVTGTALGVLFAVPVAFLGTTVVTGNRLVTSAIRFFLDIVRTIPNLLLAALMVAIVGIGEFTGVMTIAVFTFAYIGKILYEEIETVDMGAFEAMEAMGSTKVRAFISSIVPQVLPSYLSNCLFCFEGNVRYASILGYVGAGGLGLILNEKIGWREYSSVGMILLALFVTVFIIESISRAARKRLV